jgi:hypothetical protein
LRTENQIYATSTELTHGLRPHLVHAEGLLHFSVKAETSHNNNCKLDDLRAGFEITKGYWIGHALDANIWQRVEQGGLF